MTFDFEEEGARSDNFKHINRQLDFTERDLQTPQTRSLYKWWRSFHPNFPKRKDFDITQHRSLPIYVYLIEVLEPIRFRYRLNGDHVVTLVGRTLNGLEFSTSSPIFEDRILASYLSELIPKRTACRCYGNFKMLDREHINFESVDCPLVDEDGNITHFIGVLSDDFSDA